MNNTEVLEVRKKINFEDSSVRIDFNFSKFVGDNDDPHQIKIIEGKLIHVEYPEPYDGEIETIIGKFTAYICTDGIDDYLMQLDEYSIKSAHYSDELQHEIYQDLLMFENNLTVLHEISINEEYRGNGLLKYVVETLLSVFKCPIFVKPFPLQHSAIIRGNNNIDEKQFRVDLKKLKSLYKKCGFQTVRKNSKYMLHMGY